MNTDMGYTVNHLYAFCQFLLKCTFKIDALNEGANADFFVIKYSIALLAVVGEAFFGHVQAKLGDMLFGCVNCGAGAV